MVFPVVMYVYESWTIKEAEHQRIDAFELWCWRRLLRVPWTARRSSQSILEKISPECSLEGLMLKLKQYFRHLIRRADSLEKTLMLGKIEGRRRRGRQRRRWLDGITDSMDMSLSKLRSWWWTGRPRVLQSMGLQSQTGLSKWTVNSFVILSACCTVFYIQYNLCSSQHCCFPLDRLRNWHTEWLNWFAKGHTVSARTRVQTQISAGAGVFLPVYM